MVQLLITFYTHVTSRKNRNLITPLRMQNLTTIQSILAYLKRNANHPSVEPPRVWVLSISHAVVAVEQVRQVSLVEVGQDGKALLYCIMGVT